jgi:hypothetical protein
MKEEQEDQMPLFKCQTKSKTQILKFFDFKRCHSFDIWMLKFGIKKIRFGLGVYSLTKRRLVA